MKKSTLILLALCATQAAAQSSVPQPAAPAPERKADAPRPLNLKLDEPARFYVRETQPETGKGDNLPTLGGGSTSFERQPRDMRPDAGSRVTPYPTDSENSNRK